MRVPFVTPRQNWDQFWFRPAPPHDLIAARMILALNALWLVASRPFLPDIVRWPAPLWRNVNPFLRIRFLIVPLPFAAELALYGLLGLGLICVFCGIALRSTSLASAVLIYHFAPMEDIFASQGGPFFRGFTLPLLGLAIIGFARQPKAGDVPSAEYRWPVVLMQLLFSFTYLLSGLSKLRLSGISWSSGATFESIVLAMMIPDSIPPWSHYFVGHPILCWLGAGAGTAMDFFFIAAVFSRRAARIIIPLTLLAHLIIIPVLGVVFLGTPMLLLFVNWDWVRGALRRVRAARIETA